MTDLNYSENSVQDAVRPPAQWLWASAGAIAAALILSRLGQFWTSVLGYLTASFGAVGLIAVFRLQDRTARRSPYYSPVSALKRWEKVLGVAVLLACIGCAWPIATTLARG